VYVSLDNEQLTGFVGTVNPAIRDRKIEFDVNLRESNHYKLRPNLNVNLAIVREERDSVLRIRNGPAIGRGKEQQVYVLSNGSAALRDIGIGMRTEDYVEVLNGLSEGDRVVLSAISSIEDLEAKESEQ
jgi:HlyD family secretion protein